MKKWLGQKIKLSLITDAEDMNYGWAAWAEPRIVFKNRSAGFELKTIFGAKSREMACPGISGIINRVSGGL